MVSQEEYVAFLYLAPAGDADFNSFPGDKKDLLLKARFEDLEKTGGKTAVKKAMEKKRKKVAGKEKKSRPFAPGSQGGSDGSGKRRRTA